MSGRFSRDNDIVSQQRNNLMARCIKRNLLFVVAAFLTINTGLGAEDSEADRIRRDKAIQNSFARFQRFEPKATLTGHPKFQTLELNKDPIIIDGVRYDCFKFKAMKEEKFGRPKQNLVWAFVPPANLDFWYIIPESGKMNGFKRFSWRAKDSVPKFHGLKPASVSRIVLQALNGDSLVDGQDYLMLFCFKDEQVAQFSVALGFAFLETESDQEILKALGGDEVSVASASPSLAELAGEYRPRDMENPLGPSLLKADDVQITIDADGSYSYPKPDFSIGKVVNLTSSGFTLQDKNRNLAFQMRFRDGYPRSFFEVNVSQGHEIFANKDGEIHWSKREP
jgi:hypothetical protein